MLSSALNPDVLKPHLAACGYTASRLAHDYLLDGYTVPLAGFYDRPWDTRSSCLAVLQTESDGAQAASDCMGLGAPTALVCCGDYLEWWGLSPDGPKGCRRIPASSVEGFFREHMADLSPGAIYAAKMRRPTRSAHQMWFVDVGLMPAVEHRLGKTLHRLVESVIQGLTESLGGQLRTKKNFADLYKTVFWLFAAKLLHEKGVEKFRRISLDDVDEVFRRVGKHYADLEMLPPGGRAWRPAIDEAAQAIARWGYLGNLSAESIAYLYETALVDSKPSGPRAKNAAEGRDLRKELGIHSTPPTLIDYMLTRLWPLLEEVEVKNRRVFEPACGHAPFLVSAMRWLRDFSGLSDGVPRHRYLRERLHGVELDPFSRELAKLQLTLADVPHGNSWHIDDKDMFMPDVLSVGASACTLLLANPPYEAFTPAEKSDLRREGAEISAITKAVEMLNRTLSNLRPGSAFGVVLPQGFLHDKESRSAREFLLTECELMEIDVFADNLFEHGDHEVSVLLGRRSRAHERDGFVTYGRVREAGMNSFKERAAFSSKSVVPRARLETGQDSSLALPELVEIWDYLSREPKLNSTVTVQKGRQYWKEKELLRLGLASRTRRHGWIQAMLSARDGYHIYELPRVVWIDPSPAAYRGRVGGADPGTPQVVVNDARVSREPWRLKAVVDEVGLATASRFVVFRPKPGGPSLRFLWALLNSPIANAYAYCASGKRETLVKEWRAFPVPTPSAERIRAIEAAAEEYVRTVGSTGELFVNHAGMKAVRQALLAMDAEVLQLYDLPPRLERQLLDLFADVARKGVGCEFRGYYPEGMHAFVPLHELISEDYARSTLGRFRNAHRPTTDPEVLAALRAAAAESAED